MFILSIDVGIIHLALVAIELESDYLKRDEIIIEEELTTCELIDITELIVECNDVNCELYHDKIICDYVTHLFKKYRELFDKSNEILIERQPFGGISSVQELIMKEYRNKTKLISPTAMLNFFGILHIPYDERKKYTEKIATKYLEKFKTFTFNERNHDMADCLCILLYYLSMKRKEYKEKVKSENSKFIKSLDQFKYLNI